MTLPKGSLHRRKRVHDLLLQMSMQTLHHTLLPRQLTALITALLSMLCVFVLTRRRVDVCLLCLLSNGQSTTLRTRRDGVMTLPLWEAIRLPSTLRVVSLLICLLISEANKLTRYCARSNQMASCAASFVTMCQATQHNFSSTRTAVLRQTRLELCH